MSDCEKCRYGASDHIAGNIVCCYYGRGETNPSGDCEQFDPGDCEQFDEEQPPTEAHQGGKEKAPGE